MSVKTICIFTQSPLSKAPRVVKEANVYAQAGYKVTVYGLWYDKELLSNDQSLLHPDIIYKAGIDLMNWNSLQAKKIRLSRKVSRDLVKWLSMESIGALGYDFQGYLGRLEEEKADLYIGHEEMSMALAEKLIKQGQKVAFDFEDWHSRDLLPKDRVYRPLKLLKRLEHYVLEHSCYTYTTSEVMAEAMANAYQTERPRVVYNSFSKRERANIKNDPKDRKDYNTPSLYWFSQVISEGRGLELLFESLKLVNSPLQLHLRGDITDSYALILKNCIPSHVTLFFHEVVQYQELISRIAEHDIGIAFEETAPESRNYTITNKAFHYLQSGIAILATHTAGQQEIANIAPEAICIVENDPKKIATQIDYILSVPERLAEMKQASWTAGASNFAFENESHKLLEFLKQDH